MYTIRKSTPFRASRLTAVNASDGCSAHAKLNPAQARKSTRMLVIPGCCFMKSAFASLLVASFASQAKASSRPTSLVKLSAEPEPLGSSSKNVIRVKATTPIARSEKAIKRKANPRAATIARAGLRPATRPNAAAMQARAAANSAVDLSMLSAMARSASYLGRTWNESRSRLAYPPASNVRHRLLRRCGRQAEFLG